MKKIHLWIILIIIVLTLPIMLGVRKKGNFTDKASSTKNDEVLSYIRSEESNTKNDKVSDTKNNEKPYTKNDKVSSAKSSEKSYIKNDVYLVLSNKQNFLDKNYIPSNLVEPNVRFLNGATAKKMENTAAKAFEKLVAAAKKDNVNIVGVSGYRSYSRQTEIYNNTVKTRGKSYAEKYVARPGASEHQTGLTIDLNSLNYGKLEKDFENTKAFKWLMSNCHKYGFILRYPKDKQQITGYNYEPWHFRYVGEYHAAKIMKSGITLEEYLEQKIKA